jgi:hypothetical protein
MRVELAATPGCLGETSLPGCAQLPFTLTKTVPPKVLFGIVDFAYWRRS